MGEPTACPRCHEVLIASAWSDYLSPSELRQFWCCPQCGAMFETVDQVDPQSKMPAELVEQFLPALVVT